MRHMEQTVSPQLRVPAGKLLPYSDTGHRIEGESDDVQ